MESFKKNFPKQHVGGETIITHVPSADLVILDRSMRFKQ